METSRLNTRIGLALAVALGLALRLLQLNFQPLWWDEGYSVFFATRDFGAMLARTAVDIHPPLYYALMQVWRVGFGTSDVAFRLLSVAIGTAAIPLLYAVAHELFNRRVALAAAFLLAIAPLHIYYAQEVRMYGLVTLLALASVLLQLKILARDGRETRTSQHPPLNIAVLWFAYVIVTALALYTQYFAAFLVAAEMAVVAYLILRARWQIEWKQWVAAWVGVGVLYVPWVVYAGPKLYTYVTAKVGIEQYARLDPVSYLVQHLTAFSLGHVTAWTWVLWGTLLFVVLAVFGISTSRSYHVGEGNSQFAIRSELAGIYFLVPLLLGFVVNLVYTFHPEHYERLLLFAAPFFLIYIACGIVALWERERAVGILASAVVVGLCGISLFDFYTLPRYPDEDYRPLIQEMENVAAENDLVYAIYPWQIGYLEAYAHRMPLNVYEVDSNTWVNNSEAMSKQLRELRQNNARAWLLAYQKQGRILEDRLTNEYINDYLVYDQTFGNTRLEYFAQGPQTDFELTPLTFSPELTLRIQYAAFDPPTQPHLALARFAWNATTEQYAYSLRVTDAQGNKIVQQDAPIPNGATTLRRGLPLPPFMPAGDYALQLVVYRRADGAPLKTPTGAASISLAKISITH